MSTDQASPTVGNVPDATERHRQTLSDFQTLPPTGAIQFDRFCDHCGYNLRGQATRRELHTRLILIACPECGTFHPANETTPLARLWTRLRQIITVGWVAAWLGVWFTASVAYLVPTGILADEASYWLFSSEAWRDERIIGTIALLFVAIGVVIATAFTLVVLAVIAFPHWPRFAFAILSFVWPVPPMMLALLLQCARRFSTDSVFLPCAMALATAAITVAAGLVATMLARPIARIVISLLMPATWRSHVAHLWIADGLTPPGMNATAPPLMPGGSSR